MKLLDVPSDRRKVPLKGLEELVINLSGEREERRRERERDERMRKRKREKTTARLIYRNILSGRADRKWVRGKGGRMGLWGTRGLKEGSAPSPFSPFSSFSIFFYIKVN